MGRVPTIYYCPYENCNASYNRKHRYDTHIRSHTGERPFICSHEGCGKNFTSSSHLQRHEDSHGSSYRCTFEDCATILKTKATLKKHIKSVHLQLKKHKVYTCIQCGKGFNKHNTLQTHKLRHSGQLPYKCTVEDCEKAFLTPSKLKRHMKIHKGYPCKVHNCDKVFGKWSLYVQHMRDFHRTDYKCHVCAKVFSTSNRLKSHVPIHEESRLVYPCQVPNCSRYYYANRNLTWHIRKYHAKRPFMCDKENCHRAFKTEAELADHILYHGKKKPRKKNKPKKPKPSLAAILSGIAEVKQVNRKSKQPQTEENVEPDVFASSSKVNLTDWEPYTIKISSVESLEVNQSSIMEENNPSCSKSPEVIPMEILYETSQSDTSRDMNTFNSNSNDSSAMEFEVIKPLCNENILEMDQAQELNSECTSKDYIAPIEWETDISLTRLGAPKVEFTTIEVVGGENLSQLISVPLIKTENKHWKKSVAVTVETLS